MNILFISDFYPPHIYGGAEVSTSLLVKSLTKHSRCMVITSKIGNSSWEWEGVRVLPLLIRPDLGDRRISEILLFGIESIVSPIVNTIKLLKILSDESFDAINFVATSHSILPVIVLLSLLRKEKLIIDARDVSLICVSDLSYDGYEETNQKHNCYRHINQMYSHHNLIVKLLMPIFGIFEIILFKVNGYLLKKTIGHRKRICIVALSDYVKRKLVQNGFESDKIVVINNIAQEPVVRPNTRINFEYDFAHAGRLDKRKGVWDLLIAYQKIGDRNLRLAIAGNGTEYEKLKEFRQKRGLKNVDLLGRLTPNEVLKLYSKSKFIVAPVKSPEGFGRFIQESLTTGTPVIATNWGGIPEGIDENITGFLVEPNNLEDLKRTMAKAAYMPTDALNRMRSSTAKKWKQYSGRSIVERRMAIYEAGEAK